MNRQELLKRYMAGVNKQFGAGTMKRGVTVADIPRIPTGSLALDYALGGGIPVGRVTGVQGEESSGKTTLAIRVAAQAQRMCAHCWRPVEGLETSEEVDEQTGEVLTVVDGYCDCVERGLYVPEPLPNESPRDFKARAASLRDNGFRATEVAFFDLEGTFDPVWAERVGLDPNRMLYFAPETAEQALDLYVSLMRTGAVDVFILDSIAALTPSKEVEESFESWQQGLAARLVNKFVRTSQMAQNEVARSHGVKMTHLWINQLREKIGMVFGDNRVAPGGRGQRFAYSVVLRMWASKFEQESAEGLKKDDTTKAGTKARFNFKVEKNKTAPPKGAGSFLMSLAGKDAGKVDEVGYVTQLAERFGVLSKDGGKWLAGTREFATKGAAVEALMSDPALYGRVRDVFLKSLATK